MGESDAPRVPHLHKEHIMRVMSLNQLSSQTGLYVSTLRRVAKRVCGRGNGAFTEDECAAILESLTQTRTLAYAQKRLQKKASPETEAFPKKASPETEAFSYNQTHVSNNTIQLSSDTVKALDNLLQFKIPHYRDCPQHLQALTAFLTAACNKGKVAYDKDLIEARQLAEEYNRWVDSQL